MTPEQKKRVAEIKYGADNCLGEYYPCEDCLFLLALVEEKEGQLARYQLSSCGTTHLISIVNWLMSHYHLGSGYSGHIPDKVEATEAKLAKAIEAIENAPHAPNCDVVISYHVDHTLVGTCNCWKADALKEYI